MDIILESIINWCRKSNLPIAKGVTFDKHREKSYYLEFEEYQDFLNFCGSLSCAVIIYYQTIFELHEELKESLELDEDEIEEEINTSFQNFIQYDELPSHLYLLCNSNGFTYLYRITEDWYIEFEEEIENQKDFAISILENTRKPRLDPTRLNKIIERIASSTEFFTVHTRPSKMAVLVNQMVLEENVGEFQVDLYSIEKMALKQFRTKYLSQREQDCREQIGILRKDGKTKKAIIAILKITEGMYDSLVGGY